MTPARAAAGGRRASRAYDTRSKMIPLIRLRLPPPRHVTVAVTPPGLPPASPGPPLRAFPRDVPGGRASSSSPDPPSRAPPTMAKAKAKGMGKTGETTAKSLAEARAKRADRTAMLITGVATMAACLTIPFLQGQRDKHVCDALCYGICSDGHLPPTTA